MVLLAAGQARMPGPSARTEPDWPGSPRESRHDSSWLDWLQHDRQPRPVAGLLRLFVHRAEFGEHAVRLREPLPVRVAGLIIKADVTPGRRMLDAWTTGNCTPILALFPTYLRDILWKQERPHVAVS